MRLPRHLLGCLLAVVVAGCGGGGGGGGSDHGSSAGDGEPLRTVDVTMHDIRYEPASVAVKPGETVKFVFHNEGEIVHDAFIGDGAAQAAHEQEMREMGDGAMGGHHEGEGHGVTVDPGETAELTYTFEESATVIIGCHQAGHYAAGMKIAVTAA